MPIRVDILDHNQLVANLKNPVEGSLPIENIEPVVRGEPDEPIGEDMPVSDSDPGDLTEEMWSLSSLISVETKLTRG